MRFVTMAALMCMAALLILVRCCEGANIRSFAIPEEEEEYRVRPLYREYNLLRRHARADDAFDDYGHLRFGRSDD